MRKTILLSVFFVSLSLPLAAVVYPTPIYIYGFSLSFNDSTVYITDIMTLDSAWIESKNNFLYARSSYAYQLKNHLTDQGVLNPTCVVSYDLKRKKAEKKYVKLKNRYLKKNNFFTVKYVPITDFCFTAVSAALDPSVVTSLTKEGTREQRAADKAAAKQERAERKAQQMRDRRPRYGGPGGMPGGGPGGGPPPGDVRVE